MTPSNISLRLAVAVERGVIEKVQADQLADLFDVNDRLYAEYTASIARTAERYFARLVGGAVTHDQAQCDVLTKNGVALEIKWSQSRIVNNSSVSTRWSWNGVKGRSGSKKYSHLVLAGDPDERHLQFYKLDPGQPWVYFVVPFDEVDQLTIASGRKRLIQLITKPSDRLGKTGMMYSRFMVTESELRTMFA